MSLTVTVTPNETFPDDSNVTRAMLRNAASPTVQVEGSVSDGDLAAGAAVALEKLVGVTEGQILVGSSTGHASGGSNKKIAAVSPSSNASVTAAGAITPSDATITKAKLSADNTNNIIMGQDGLSNVNSADSVLVFDADGPTGDRLKRATVSSLLNAGVSSTTQDVTDLGTYTSGTTPVNVDFDQNPVQILEINTTTVSQTLNISVSNTPGDATTTKSVELRLKHVGSEDVGLAFSGMAFLRTTPNTLGQGSGSPRYAVLALTAYNDTVIAGYAAQT